VLLLRDEQSIRFKREQAHKPVFCFAFFLDFFLNAKTVQLFS